LGKVFFWKCNFVDEIFRVYTNKNITLLLLNMTEEVKMMVNRAKVILIDLNIRKL